jgi:hypothetical protein
MPLNIVVAWACALLLVDLFIQSASGYSDAAAIGLVVAMGFALRVGEGVAFVMIIVDGFAVS